MVWGLCLHHSRKFLSHLRKLKLARRGVLSLFFRTKPSYIFLSFILTNSIMAVKLRKCQISLLTTQSPTTEHPWHLSAEPGVFLDFFSQSSPPYPVPFYCVSNSPGITSGPSKPGWQPVPFGNVPAAARTVWVAAGGGRRRGDFSSWSPQREASYSRIPRPGGDSLPTPSPTPYFLLWLVEGPGTKLLYPEDHLTIGLGQQSLAVYL